MKEGVAVINYDFPYAYENKLYHTLAFENQVRGYKLHKAAVDAGFTCPNIDGTKGTGGCVFCSGGSGYFTAPAETPIEEQIAREMERLRQKDESARAVAYFQAHTNTYAPLETLRDLYERALRCDGICGLAIATRPDALNGDVLVYLKELSGRTMLTVELGLQTIHQRTAKIINRGYSLEEFMEAYKALKIRGIRTCVHLINGLPGETKQMMLETASYVGQLRPEGVKIHMLHVIRGTAMEKLYAAKKYRPMSMDEYVRLVCCQLEVLPPETVIERLTGDGNKETLVAPAWTRDKIRVLGSIDETLSRWDTWQGHYFAGREERIRDFLNLEHRGGW